MLDGLVNRIAPLSLPACAFIARVFKAGHQTGVATMRPASTATSPAGSR